MITVKDARPADLNDCLECLDNSLLAYHYFGDREMLRATISDAIIRREVHVVALKGETVGLMRINYEGMFGQFPYLRLLAVMDCHRNRGIGGTAFSFFEETGFARSKSLFVCVSDFNKDAKRFYEAKGFTEAAKIKDLFKKGITEWIMIKNK